MSVFLSIYNRNRNSFEDVLQAVLSSLGALLTIQATDRKTLKNLLLQLIKSTEKSKSCVFSYLGFQLVF